MKSEKKINKARVSEKSVQDTMITELKKLGLFVWRNNTARIPLAYKGKARVIAVGMKGMPDILGYLPSGQGFAIEVKRDAKEMPSEMQQLRIRQLEKTNVVAFCSHSVDDVLNRILPLISS